MKKTTRIILISTIVAGIAISIGAYFMLNGKKTVDVIAVSNVMDEGYDETTNYGNIMAGSSETYKKSSTEVKEILVAEGQEVNPGDALFRYDTASLSIAKSAAETKLTKAKLEVQKDQAELARWQTYTPYQPYVPYTIDTMDVINGEEETQAQRTGTGTANDPYVFNCDSSTKVVPQYLLDLMDQEESTGITIYVNFVIYDHNDGADMVDYYVWQFHTHDDDEGSHRQALENIRAVPGVWYPGQDLDFNEGSGFAEGSYTGKTLPEAPSVPESKSYSAEEIASNIASIKSQLASDQIAVKQAQIDYQKAANAATDGTVTTSCKGTVSKVNDLNTIADGEVFLQVTSETGFVLETAISEYQLSDISKGSALGVYSYNNGISAEATITYISEAPTDTYSTGVPNVSYYTVRATLPSDANMSVGDWCEITIPTNVDTNAFYLPMMYVRKENGSSYVMKVEDGKLKKQVVKTGKTLWGYEVQILDGLSQEDYIAFPYGKKVKEGAPCDLGEDSDVE